MSYLPGRYFSERDISFINGINDELLGDVIQTVATIFKICPESTKVNMYGESDQKAGKQYFPGIEVVCLVEREDISTEPSDFGPTRSQDSIFRFMEKDLQAVNLFPQNGDLIHFNDRYYMCDNIVQEQLLGGIPQKSFSIIVHGHYTSLSSIDLVERHT